MKPSEEKQQPEANESNQPDTDKEMNEEELGQVNGGSQSTGAGAGKVTFNPFSITRKMDKSTNNLQ